MEGKDSLTEPLCELFEIIEDPIPVIKYLESRKRNEATILDMIKTLSIDEICSLWDILKASKYTKDPTKIVKNTINYNFIMHRYRLK